MTNHLHLKPWLGTSGTTHRYVFRICLHGAVRDKIFIFLLLFADESANIRWGKNDISHQKPL